MEMIDKGALAVSQELNERMRRTDEATEARLKEIVLEHGWPGLDLVSLDGSSAASTMLQHVSAETQRTILPLVEAGFRTGQVMGQDYALLIDSTRQSEGKPQLYGTNFQLKGDGKIEFDPIEDEANVDARRAEVGLPPLEEFRRLATEMYFPKKEGPR
jgi:hypothetical protein